ncbi:5-oxoprolinase subunit PxpB [Ilyobacter sp.]|uniref:5-oxoprolinase subunit PxpB n=1 Tax=Ilyobacter sp. TaxID=3100343 RepID=UPI0035634205
MRFLYAGDSSIVIEFGNEISKDINRELRNLTDALDNLNYDFIREIVPTYRSIIVHYDSLKISFEKLKEKIVEAGNTKRDSEEKKINIVEIPVLYGEEAGPDLEEVAKHNGLSIEDVIKIHSSGEYLIYMLGFTPGFPYLGGMDEKIATPRLAKPRLKIPAGSVGIAGSQTGIYPMESPGGWQLIGKTPLDLFDPQSKDPFLLNAGDYIRFIPITKEEYDSVIRDKMEVNK